MPMERAQGQMCVPTAVWRVRCRLRLGETDAPRLPTLQSYLSDAGGVPHHIDAAGVGGEY